MTSLLWWNAASLFKESDDEGGLAWEEPPDQFYLDKKSVTQVKLLDENDGMKELTRIMSPLGTKRTNER